MRVSLLRILGLLLVAAVLVAGVPGQAVRAQANAGVDPASGTVGTTFTFFIDGLQNDEEVDYWITGPGSPEPFERGRYRTVLGENGRLTWAWTAPQGVWNGTWTWNIRGLTSNTLASVPFQISGASGAVINSGVEPARGAAGTTFTFSTDGWPKGDVVDYWVLAPGRTEAFALGRIYGDPNEQGRTIWRWKAPDDIYAGTWTMNARGFYSEIFVQIPFMLDGPPPPPPPTSGVSTRQARPGDTLTFSASGFEGGEEIAWWANAPDALEPVARSGVNEFKAQADGSFRFDWQVPADANSGQWSMVIRGVDSGFEQQILFEVVEGGSAPPQPGGQVVMQPLSGPPGTTFSFSVSGFRRKDTINYWATGPEGQVVSDNKQILADGDGNVEWTYTIPSDVQSGPWVMTVRGLRTNKSIEIPFEITGDSRGPAAPAQGVEPASGGPGTTFTFFAEGFKSKESVGWWLTTPSGSTIQGQNREASEGGGRVEWIWTAPADAQNGQWFAVARGKEGGRELRIAFSISGGSDSAPPASGASGSVSPDRGSSGTIFEFNAQGLTPSERLGFWVDGPDGKRYPGERDLTASRQGSVAWSWQAPAGLAPGSYTMILQSKPGGEANGNASVRIGFTIQP